MENYTNLLLLAIVLLIAIIVISKLGFVSIKKKKIKMELEHLKDIYLISWRELADLRIDEKSEKVNATAIFSQTQYLNILVGRVHGYCYLLDYTYEYGANSIVIYDKKKNEVI